MNPVVEYIIAFLLVVGAGFAAIGSWGLLKLDDFYMRLHGPTKATTLGLGSMLVASSIYFTATTEQVSLHEVLITVFLFITAPVSAHILAKNALLDGFDFRGGQRDPLEHSLDEQRDGEEPSGDREG
jgi:multicomponent K+:H+ antiporter subunit G